jgi:hypothetical protein
VIGWGPTINVLVVRVASPPLNVPVPRTVAPSRNVIAPVAPVGAVAVKVTDWLTIEGLSDDVTVTVGAALTTVTMTGGEVAGLLLASPGVLAVMGSVPSGRLVIVMVATPPMTGAVPIGVEPLENVTGPDTPGGTVSVIVTGVPKVGLFVDTTGIGSTGVSLLTVCERGAETAELWFASPP